MEAIALDLRNIAMTAISRIEPPRPVMTGVSKRIWMLLYREGGWWSVAEICKELGSGPTTHVNVRDMVTSGFLARKDDADQYGERRVRFGVTKACKMPRGVTLEEIEESLQGAIREYRELQAKRGARKIKNKGRQRVGGLLGQIQLALGI